MITSSLSAVGTLQARIAQLDLAPQRVTGRLVGKRHLPSRTSPSGMRCCTSELSCSSAQSVSLPGLAVQRNNAAGVDRHLPFPRFLVIGNRDVGCEARELFPDGAAFAGPRAGHRPPRALRRWRCSGARRPAACSSGASGRTSCRRACRSRPARCARPARHSGRLRRRSTLASPCSSVFRSCCSPAGSTTTSSAAGRRLALKSTASLSLSPARCGTMSSASRSGPRQFLSHRWPSRRRVAWRSSAAACRTDRVGRRHSRRSASRLAPFAAAPASGSSADSSPAGLPTVRSVTWSWALRDQALVWAILAIRCGSPGSGVSEK